MKGLKFKKGDFITQRNCRDSFAIFGGEAYEPVKKGDGFDYSLICYCNPSHYTQDSKGNWIHEDVFEYDLDDTETCEYTINESDMEYWRLCTASEIDNALITLSKKRLGWVKESKSLRKLKVCENVVIDETDIPRSTGVPGGSVRHLGHTGPQSNNPYYRGNTTVTKKTISIRVDENWEQKEPISTMNVERKELVLSQCEKLKYAFDTYRYNNVTVYPQSGAQVPRRTACFGGYGMCAYDALMQGSDWWGYCD